MLFEKDLPVSSVGLRELPVQGSSREPGSGRGGYPRVAQPGTHGRDSRRRLSTLEKN